MNAHFFYRVWRRVRLLVELDRLPVELALFGEGFRLFRANIHATVLDEGAIRRRVVEIDLDHHQLVVLLLDFGGKCAHRAMVDFFDFDRHFVTFGKRRFKLDFVVGAERLFFVVDFSDKVDEAIGVNCVGCQLDRGHGLVSIVANYNGGRRS